MAEIIQTMAMTEAAIAAIPPFPMERAMGTKTINADMVARAIRRRCESCVPIQGIRMMLKARAPKIPPTVLAA